MKPISNNLRGGGFLVLGMLIFSLQDIAVKWMGGDYPVLEIVTMRSVVAIPLTLLFFRAEGGRGLPATRRYKLEFVRGLLFFLSYTTHFMSLAALPLAEIAAIKFSGPLMITLLSVLILGELVGPRRWTALFVGFAGVLLIVRPGLTGFNLGSIFVLLSVFFYALATMLTRKLQTTDSSATMAYYSSLVYLVATVILTPITLFIGDAPDAHPSIAFLLHSWAIPTLLDGVIMAGLGLIWAGGMYCLARAYSLALASVVAPFEYVALPINILWGFLLWREIPTWLTLAGAALTLGSGLYILFRERQMREKTAPIPPPDVVEEQLQNP
ncbi:MAG: DMT family transporter [Caldilineaceae bacterium]|nr:DMT family transporter [Caldilineaceae bacterium]